MTFGGGFFFANYMIDAISKVYQFDVDGNSLGEIQLPGVGSSGGFSSKKEYFKKTDKKSKYFVKI